MGNAAQTELLSLAEPHYLPLVAVGRRSLLTKRILSAAVVIAHFGWPAHAQLDNYVEICSDPNAAPHDVVRFCQQALDTGRLDRRAEAQVRTNLGVGYFDLDRLNDAMREYTRAIALAPDMTAAFLNRARTFQKLGRLQEAVADYDAVLRRDPRSADAYFGRGALLLRHGDPARALGDLDMAVRLEPDWTAALFNRGAANLQLGRYERAVRDFTDVIGKDPRDAGAYLNRARARQQLDPAAARADYDRAIEISPEWGDAWFARGQYWDARGDREAANGDFLRAYELGYSDPWLLRRIREISG